VTLTRARIVATDANIIINLFHVGRLDLCELIPGYELVVPDHVREEILLPAERTALDGAIARGVFRLEAITNLETIALFSELRSHIGRGEAACLAMAVEKGWSIASDEKRRFRREAEARLGRGRLIGTADLFVLAIRAELISVEEADADKATLERCRFKLPFESFRDVMAADERGELRVAQTQHEPSAALSLVGHPGEPSRRS